MFGVGIHPIIPHLAVAFVRVQTIRLQIVLAISGDQTRVEPIRFFVFVSPSTTMDHHHHHHADPPQTRRRVLGLRLPEVEAWSLAGPSSLLMMVYATAKTRRMYGNNVQTSNTYSIVEEEGIEAKV
jgi:hypothetical protein